MTFLLKCLQGKSHGYRLDNNNRRQPTAELIPGTKLEGFPKQQWKKNHKHTDLTDAEPLLITGDGLLGVFCTVSPKMPPSHCCLNQMDFLCPCAFMADSTLLHNTCGIQRLHTSTPATASLIAIFHTSWNFCLLSSHSFITDTMRAFNNRYSRRVHSPLSLHIIIKDPHQGTCRHAADYSLISITDWTGWKICKIILKIAEIWKLGFLKRAASDCINVVRRIIVFYSFW